MNSAAAQEITIYGDSLPRVPDGEYELSFQDHTTTYLYGRSPKVCCYFKIVTIGPHFEQILPRYYNVKTLNTKPRKRGGFTVGRHSDFLREYVRLFGLPSRQDRISTEAFRNVIVIGRTKTVDVDSKQRVIPEPLRYSVIAELTGLVR